MLRYGASQRKRGKHKETKIQREREKKPIRKRKGGRLKEKKWEILIALYVIIMF